MAASAGTAFRNGEEGKKLMKGATEFAWNLYKELLKENPNGNVFFSPASISIALGMTYLGARGNSAEQMKNVLKFDEVHEDHLHTSFADLLQALKSPDDSFKLHTANRLYGHHDYKFLEEFLEQTRKHYGAELEAVNFGDDAVRQRINKWVEDQTNEKIKNLLADPLDPLTRLILVNAIYFKGDWANQFDKKNTRLDKFHMPGGGGDVSVDVELMYQKKKFPFGWHHELQCKAIELPYVKDDLSMVILLPDATDGLAKVEEGLTLEHLLDVHSAFHMGSDEKVETWLPKFKIEHSASLGTLLAGMGMGDIFTAGVADLSGLDGTRELFVSAVLHKAFIEVNEEGSEAAAATAFVIMPECFVENQMTPEFRADHPFFYFIQQKQTGSILFMGRMAVPVKAGLTKEEL